MILIINCGSQKTPYIEQAVDLQMDYKTIGLWDATPESVGDSIGIIISGAPILVTEVDNIPYIEQLAWILNAEVPILGICFGHQILGIMHGSTASIQKEDRDWQTLESIEDHPIFDKLPTEFEMVEDHCESISIPRGFKLLAVSDACINEAMYRISKPWIGVQFHPEVSGNLGTTVIENFVDICVKHASSKTNN